MSELVTRAQLELLARTLHVPVERVPHLDRLDAQEIMSLREAMSNVLFDGHAETFKRIIALVPLAPLSIFIPIVEKLVPPMMSGRAAGAIGVAHPKKAAPALAIMSTKYAAESAPYMDPRAVAKLVDYAPPGPVVAIANEIIGRQDFATAGMFVDFATPELVRAVEEGVQDDEGLLRSGSYVLSGKTLSTVVRLIRDNSPDRLHRLAKAAVGGPTDLRLATLSVWSRLDTDLIESIGDILVEVIPADDVADLVRCYVTEGAAAEWLSFVGRVTPTALDWLAANPVHSDDDIVAAYQRAAAEHDTPAVQRALQAILS